jgi:hypothetical protein
MSTCPHCHSPKVGAVGRAGVDGEVTEFRCKACGKEWAELGARTDRDSKRTPSQWSPGGADSSQSAKTDT